MSQELEDWSQNRHPANVFTSQNLKSAEELMTRGFGDIDKVYADLVAKYKDICRRSIHQTIVGINDKPIGKAVSSRGNDYCFRKLGAVITNPDLRTVFTNDSMPGRIAEHYAMAEFVLKNDLSDFVTISPRAMEDLNASIKDGSKVTRASHDSHVVGTLINTLNITYFELSNSACLIELIDQLKNVGQFNNIMIDSSGEFGRKPLDDSTGNEHDGDAGSCAMWSGPLIKKLISLEMFTIIKVVG